MRTERAFVIVNRPWTFVCCSLWYGFTLYVHFFHSVTASTVFLLLADIEDVLPERSDSRSKSFSVMGYGEHEKDVAQNAPESTLDNGMVY